MKETVVGDYLSFLDVHLSTSFVDLKTYFPYTNAL